MATWHQRFWPVARYYPEGDHGAPY